MYTNSKFEELPEEFDSRNSREILYEVFKNAFDNKNSD